MKTNSTNPTRSSRRISPLLIIGGSVLVLAVAFYFVSRVMIDNRDPEATRALAEAAEERDAAGEQGATQGNATVFREDAVLSFLGPNGAKRAELRIEIAEDDVARTQGLMGRQVMAEDQGMLFIFPNEEFRSFWMANTPLSLDIIFVNSAREIVTIQRDAVPFSEESVPSTKPATYVVEVNAGYADRHGLAEGDRVQWNRK